MIPWGGLLRGPHGALGHHAATHHEHPEGNKPTPYIQEMQTDGSHDSHFGANTSWSVDSP